MFYKYIAIGILFSSIHIQGQITLSIKDALARANSGNPFLQSQRYEIDKAKTDITTAGLRLNPDFQAQIYFMPTSKYYAENTGILHPKNTQSWLQVGMPFRLQPVRRLGTGLAQQNVNMISSDIKESQRNLALETANQWLNVWGTKKQLDILLLSKGNVDSLVKINENRLKNQFILPSELIRTQVLQEQYELQIRSLIQENRNETKNLATLLGIQQDSLTIAENDDFVFNERIPNLDSLIQIALRSRADIQLAETAIKLSESNISFQKALAYPNLYVATFFNPQNTVPYMGFIGGIQIPIFNRNQGEIAKSQLQKKQSESYSDALRKKLSNDINVALNTYRIQQGNMERVKHIMEQSQTVLRTVKYAYLKGNTTVIDYLEAQRTALETQQLHYETLLNLRKSHIFLLYTTGEINTFTP